MPSSSESKSAEVVPTVMAENSQHEIVEMKASDVEAAQCASTVGQGRVNYLGQHSTEDVAKPVAYAARLATLGSRYNAVNWAWGIFVTMVLPGIGSVIWYGVIPVGSPVSDKAAKAVWVFVINPVTMSFLSFLLVTLFFTAINEEQPWRPVQNYVHIPITVGLTQMLFPGLFVLFKKPFPMLALASICNVFVVSLVGLRFTPHIWLDCNPDRYYNTWTVFRKISIVFVVYAAILAGYMVANAESEGAGQGFLTVALNIIGFIFKKILLAFTDPVSIETAMLISGFWLENLTDLFITLAFPTAERFGATFAIIFVTRMAENLLYLWFQLDIWFKFRIWIKGKFKEDQAVAIEEDAPEYADDRGHSAHHPGYRRRQLRFLVMKLFSQIQSYVYFVVVVPVLRYGPNKRRFPFSEPPDAVPEEAARDEDALPEEYIEPLYPDTVLDDSLQYLSYVQFKRAMAFCVFSICAVLVGGAGIWAWMHHYHREIIVDLRKRYNVVVVQEAHYGLVLSVLMVNALIATSYLSVYYRVYFI